MLTLPWPNVRKHANNNSSSKSAYAFPKDNRFKESFRVLCDSFYNVPSQMGKSPSSKMSKSTKITLACNTMVPSPQEYRIRSQFETTKGIRFGLGRDKIKGGMLELSTTPEPGHYEIKSPLNSKRGFSIYSKLPAPVFSYEKTPGPGHYISYPSINANGKYVLSKLGDCPGYKIKESKEYDTSKSRMVPGPGAYKDKENLNDSGKYFNSKHQSSRCRTFSRTKKESCCLKDKSQALVPGPGSYTVVSEFGGKV